MTIHRNSQKRIYVEEGIYFVTFNTKDKYPYFVEDIFCEVFVDNLRICIELKHFKLYAYCLLHDHAHLLLKPGRGYNVSKIIQGLKKNVSQDINKLIGIYPEGANSNSRLRRVDITKYFQKINKKYKKHPDMFPQFAWQKSFHDHVIRDEQDFANHFRYTAYNHLKHGLGECWRYTSSNRPNFANKA